MQKNPLRIGVLLTSETQMLDLSGIDLFGMITKEYLESGLPKPLVDLGLDVKIWYIGQSSGSEENKFQNLTAQAAIRTTATLQEDGVQPGSIDILFIPGPDPRQKHEQETLDFVKAHAQHGTTILVVCTGCFIAAEAGILDNRSASGPRALVPNLRKKYTAVRWDDKRRYVKDVVSRDGEAQQELWTSGMYFFPKSSLYCSFPVG